MNSTARYASCEERIVSVASMRTRLEIAGNISSQSSAQSVVVVFWQ
jgi:hypothetical protein